MPAVLESRPPRPPDPSYSGIIRHARARAEQTLREYRAVAAALFERRQTLLTDRQRGLMTNLLRRIVDDIEATLHQLLLAGGEGEDWVAREAMETVHRRGMSGAYERLAETGALNDLMLVEAVTQRVHEHQLDRSLRRPSTHGWSGPGAYDDETLSAILAPDGAHDVLDALEAYALDRSLRIDGYGNPVIESAELDGTLLVRLHWLVAAALRESLPAGDGDQRTRIDEVLEQAVGLAMDRLRAAAAAGSRAARVARAMDEAGTLDLEMALQTLRCAEVPLFEAMLIRITRLRPLLLRRLVYETGGESFATVLRALAAPHEVFIELYSLTRRAHASPPADETADIERIVDFFESVPVAVARQAHFYWQRNPALLSALWRIGGERESGAD